MTVVDLAGILDLRKRAKFSYSCLNGFSQT